MVIGNVHNSCHDYCMHPYESYYSWHNEYLFFLITAVEYLENVRIMAVVLSNLNVLVCFLRQLG